MVEEALKLINELYETKDGSVGGYGYIVFDDGNIEDGHIEWCIEEANKETYKNDLCEETRQASLKALNCFLLLEDYEREIVYDKFWVEN